MPADGALGRKHSLSARLPCAARPLRWATRRLYATSANGAVVPCDPRRVGALVVV